MAFSFKPTPFGEIRAGTHSENQDMRTTLISKFIAALIVCAMAAIPAKAAAADEAEQCDISNPAELQAGAELTALNNQLLAAAESGDYDGACQAIRDGANVDARDQEYNATPLHKAIRPDNPDVVRLLIRAGAGLNPQNSSGLTPLDRADAWQRAEISSVLRTAGATCSARADGAYCSDETAPPPPPAPPPPTDNCDLSSIASPDDEAEMEALNTAMLAAAERGDYAGVCTALQGGAQVNARDQEYNATSLHKAVRPNILQTTRLLIRAGADVNLRNINGLTPLDRTHKWNRREMAELLKESNAVCRERSGGLCD